MTNVLSLSLPSTANMGEVNHSNPSENALMSVLKAFEQWRKNKKTAAEAIPDALCQQIFALEPDYSPPQLRRFFSLSHRQYQAKREKYFPDDKHSAAAERMKESPPGAKASAVTPPPKLCEIKIKPESPYALEPLPSAKTLVVELCRSDGQIMKIHTTQDSIPTLMQSFFGESHANHYR